MFLASSAHGPGVSTDAAMHLATADNLLRGRGLVDYRGAVFTQFPPLYSLLLAFGACYFDRTFSSSGGRSTLSSSAP